MRAARCFSFIGLLASAGFALAAAPLAAEPATTSPNWAQWRGPDGLGIAKDAAVPLEWSATKNVVWSAEIPGRGHSSPVVWGDRIFLTTAVEGDVVPGAKAVRHVLEGQDFQHPDGVGADRKQTLEVLALDAKSGKILWQKTA